MARQKPKPTPLDPAVPSVIEFTIGMPEFRVGQPEFRIGIPEPGPVVEPEADGPPATEGHAGLPPLPRGWEPVPTQPPWSFPADELAPGELTRLDRPRKRYRGLSAIRAYVEPDHIEEILDLLVHNARHNVSGPESVSAFLLEAVQAELARRRTADKVGEQYPDYTAQGILPKRGRRPGVRPQTPARTEPLKPVVARIPAALAAELRDCVIHRNGGQGDGPNTVSQFVADAVATLLADQRALDNVTRYPASTASQRRKHLDLRVLRGLD